MESEPVLKYIFNTREIIEEKYGLKKTIPSFLVLFLWN